MAFWAVILFIVNIMFSLGWAQGNYWIIFFGFFFVYSFWIWMSTHRRNVVRKYEMSTKFITGQHQHYDKKAIKIKQFWSFVTEQQANIICFSDDSMKFNKKFIILVYCTHTHTPKHSTCWNCTWSNPIWMIGEWYRERHTKIIRNFSDF